LNLFIFLKKVKNSFLTPRINSLNYEKLYKKNNFFFKILNHLLWLYPSNLQYKYWMNANNIGHGYNQFLEIDTNAELLIEKINNYAQKDDVILDICCNVGRVLNELSNQGYRNLYGFDLNNEAIEKSKKIFTKLHSANLTSASAEEYLKDLKNNFFDVSYSLGATLELIPPQFDLIKHISRTTKKYFICLISENGHAYPRFWKYEFKKNDFLIAERKKIENNRTLFVLKKKIIT
jgi:SAM-dependent methyltransferase